MEYHKYSLAKKGKSICPECKRKTFVLYIDNYTGEPLHSTVGKCDRADNCGHHYTPKQYLTDNNISFDMEKDYTRPIPKPQPKPSFIDTGLLKKTLNGYDENRFSQYLYKTVGGK
ncbi:MAG: PG0870-related protein, partial [Bacteroidales bacterium]|nr:PG0870-related protein [Bacteroidales bacterium]